MEKKLQYPYLSIDQLKKTKSKHCQFKEELQGFFNIKFDLRNHLKQSTQLKITSKIVSENAKTEPAQTCLPTKSVETLQDNIHNSSCQDNKKRHSTQMMLQNISKILIKEQTFQHLSQHLSPKKKKSLVRLEGFSKQKKNSKPEIEGLFCGQNKETSLCPQKTKKLHFQMMLKKCQKLKQIYKYQNELINTKNLSSQGMGIRFYTEPFNTIISQQENIQQKIVHNATPASKRAVQLKLTSFIDKSCPKPFLNNQKTLDIRKYKNESVLKQRLKYVINKSQQNDQRIRYSRKSEPVKHHQKRLQHQYTDCQQATKDKVGPWDQLEQKQDLQFQLK